MRSDLLPFAYIALSSYFSLLLALLFEVKSLDPFVAFFRKGILLISMMVFFNLRVM